MAYPTYSLLTLWLVIMSVCSAQSTYYVKPTPDTVCPTSPCLTLSQCVERAKDRLFPSDTTLVFLPGNHNLESSLVIANASRFVMIAGNSAFHSKTMIVCSSWAAFVFKNISVLQIHALEIINCGGDAPFTIGVISVPQSQINNCTISGSVYSSIFVTDSDITLRESSLTDNSRQGIMLSRSTANLFENTFSNNRGCGIESIYSTVILIGTNSFLNNFADTRGGGIMALSSIIYITGNATFIDNRGAEGGGGIYVDDTTIVCEGTISFLHNSACDGGGMVVTRSNVSLSGQNTFVNNLATDCISESETNVSMCSSNDHFGGGVAVWSSSSLYLKGNTTFESNSATLGGGIDLEDSELFIEGETRFLINSAEVGGGIKVFFASVHLTGNTVFTSNLARGEGGGIAIGDSSLICDGYTKFVGNKAGLMGGGLLMVNSSGEIRGSNYFLANSGNYGGGFSAITDSYVSLVGSAIFTDNSAIDGGGIHIQSNSVLKSEGYIMFANNHVDYVGGGLATIRSTVKFIGSNNFRNNSARLIGGGIFAVNGSVILCGNTNLIQNSVLSFGGGGIFTQNSTVKLSGNNYIANNSANYSGGGISVIASNMTLHGSTILLHNTAEIGGALSAELESYLMLSGKTHIEKNTAVYGGGIDLQDTNLKCEGSLLIESNQASYSGGGMRFLNSTVTIEGNINSTSNSAVYGGGFVAASKTHLILNGSITFTKNTAKSGGGSYAVESMIACGGNISFVNNLVEYAGAGLMASNSIIKLEGTHSFKYNLADYGGGIACNGSSLILRGSTIYDSNLAIYGGAIHLWHHNHLSSKGYLVFTNNSAEFGGGILCPFESHLQFSGVNTYVNNTANFGGGALLAMYGCKIALSESNTFINNSADYGGAAHFTNTTVTFTGRSRFFNNSAVQGGAIHSRMVTLRISDVINFTGNSATTSGGGLSLVGSSQCILSPNTTIYLSGNHAEQYGGAIFIADDPFLYCSYELTNLGAESFQERCFFQSPNLPHDNAGINVHFMLQNNSAKEAGSAVYGGMLDRCSLTSVDNVSSGAWFDTIFAIIEDKTNNATTAVSAISSDPIQVCTCYSDYINCSVSQINITAFPGEISVVHVVAVGQRNGMVPSLIRSTLNRSTSTLDGLQDAQSAGTKCTPLQYTVFSENKAVVLQLYADGVCLEQGRPLTINMDVLPCPIAFELSDTTKGCVCEERLRRYTDRCNITTRMIEHTGEIWVGLNDYGTILHPHCPFDYCKAHTVAFTMNETDVQCNYDRRGLLCGDCQPGLSLVLGTSHCLHCENTYLLLLIGFGIAGITLVIFILACKLTVAVGTINGLIFYANIVAVNKSVFLDSNERVLSVFIAWVNLDLGIETCFYDGMHTYERTWLQFIFPAYIWVLVGIIIILANRYPWAARLFGRNPVAVLATLFLLSYAKLLNTLIAALSFTFLNYPDGSQVAVWLYDGNIGYLMGKHIPLFMAALLVLIVLFLPYTLFLLLGQWIQARSETRIFSWINDYRVKSFIDAYHGPFRDEHRYWNGLLLVVRCFLFLVFAFNALGNPNVNLLTIVISTIMLLVLLLFSGGRIYKNWYLQALDVSYIVNIVVLAAATYYVRCSGGNQAVLTYISVGIALLTFIGTMVYHVFTQIKGSHVWREMIAPKLQHRQQRQWVAVPTVPPPEAPEAPTAPHLPTRSIVDLSALIREDESNL